MSTEPSIPEDGRISVDVCELDGPHFDLVKAVTVLLLLVANPTNASYNASAEKIYSATSSLAYINACVVVVIRT
jgi:hypothetical protein